MTYCLNCGSDDLEVAVHYRGTGYYAVSNGVVSDLEGDTVDEVIKYLPFCRTCGQEYEEVSEYKEITIEIDSNERRFRKLRRRGYDD